MSKGAVFFKAMKPVKPKKPAAAPAAKPEEKPAAKQPAKPAEGGDAASLSSYHHLLGMLAKHGAGTGDYGPHNVEAGHHVAFRAGSYSGSGKVNATGRDGLVVQDEGQREHKIHWREVTGHFAPEK